MEILSRNKWRDDVSWINTIETVLDTRISYRMILLNFVNIFHSFVKLEH